jgi:hypothetical protein
VSVRALAFVFALGCHKPEPAVITEPPAPIATPGPKQSPESIERTLEDIEAALIERDFQLRFDVEATGQVQARLVGEVRTKGDWLAISARGSFAGQNVELALEGDGERLFGSSGAARLEVAQPAELEDAVVIGLTRMGILHNLAVLVSARPPDHADGGVREWAQVKDVVAEARVTPDALSEEAKALAPAVISFGIVVAGRDTGEATLWWDRQTGLPVERHQIVRFPAGEMHVRETYQGE